MGYDRGDRLPFDFEPNENPFGSKSKRKPLPRSYLIQFERKWESSFSVRGNLSSRGGIVSIVLMFHRTMHKMQVLGSVNLTRL